MERVPITVKPAARKAEAGVDTTEIMGTMEATAVIDRRDNE